MKAATFTDFVSNLGVQLTPAQRVLSLVEHNGVDPVDLEPDDRQLARSMFGDVDRVPALAREVVCEVIGGRSGKSWKSALRLLHLGLVIDCSPLAPGEQCFGLIVAPDLKTGRQELRFALGAARADRRLSKLIVSEGKESFTIRRPDGRIVAFECLAASEGGRSLRGRSLCGAVMSECAFFYSKDYVVCDVEIYKAIAPRIMPGGQLMMPSTPFAETGLLYDTFSSNFGKPTTALVAHVSTTTMRPDARTRSIVERERERDPDNAAREFGSDDEPPRFMSAGTSAFFDPLTIDAAFAEAA